MLLGIISDTHNNLSNLRTALDMFRREGVADIIHCGDLTTPATARALAGFRVIHVLGNGDMAAGEIRAALLESNPDSCSGDMFTGDLGGRRIAAAHGHNRRLLEALITSGHYDFVFCGHSHRRRDELIGSTRVVNPGALGGTNREERSVCILDLATGDLRFLAI